MKKLYCLVRKDLKPKYQAVQAGHAVAELILRGDTDGWDNGYLIYLGVENELSLKKWATRLDAKGIGYTQFNEPDIGNEITALAVVSDGKIFSNLGLL